MSIQYKAQRVNLEILKFFSNICNKYGFKYSLGFETLYAAKKYNGFAENQCNIDIMMLYDEYKNFLDVCKDELEDTEYYIANYSTRKDIDHLYTNFCRKSGVRLSERRRNDEYYYDYSIKIYPIFSVANRKDDFEKVLEEYVNNEYIINSRARGKNLVGEKEKHYVSFISKFINKDKNDALNRIISLAGISDKKNKYSLLPIQIKVSENEYNNYKILLKKSICSTEIYLEYTDIDFEGSKFMVIEKYNDWICEYYNDKKDILETLPKNLVVLNGPEERRRVQLIQTELLKEVDRICRKNDIKYSLAAGTLLGAVRHGGFIPWDFDADVIMLRKDYEKFCSIFKKETDNEKYFLENNEEKMDKHLVYSKVRRNNTAMGRYLSFEEGINIDIFPLYNGSDNVILHKLQTKICVFFKTVCWANVRADSITDFKKRFKYRTMKLIPLRTAYRLYLKFAKIFENKESSHISWLVAASNPFYSEYTKKENYEDTVDYCFEGYTFKVISGYEKYLKAAYNEYEMIPPSYSFYGYYNFSFLDTGGLYKNINIEEVS